MKTIISTYILLFILSGVIPAQEFTYNLNFTWSKYSSDINPFNFEESNGFNDEELPVYLIQIPIEGVVNIDSVQTNNSIDETLIEDKKEIDFLQGKTHELISKRIVTIRKKNFVEIEITPLTHNIPTHTYNKVNSIQLSINIPTRKQAAVLKTQQATSSNNSVLANGKWVKIKISETGVQKISYSQLSSWGFSDPSKVNVFGNGGNMLPKLNSAVRASDLIENAILHKNNAIYFYAQGAIKWEYNHEEDMFLHSLHHFTDDAFYFLSDENGTNKRISPSTKTSDTYNHETNEYDSYQFHEFENQNLLKSGSKWYGDRFDIDQTHRYSFTFDNLVSSQELRIRTCAIGRSSKANEYKTYINGSSDPLQTINIAPVTYNSYVSSFASAGYNTASFYSNTNTIDIAITYSAINSGSSGWMDFISINAKEKLTFNDQLSFRNKDVSSTGETCQFYIDNTNSNSILWDVSEHTNPQSIALNTYGGKVGFTYSTDELNEFVVFDENATLLQPEFEGTVENQNLRASPVPDMLIIAHPYFSDEAERLAQIHQNNSGLECLVVEPEQIYNEFSSGSPDVTAYRDFVRHLYLQGDKLKYLLLFGDGSYDNKNYSEENTNLLLTYQSENSLGISKTYTADDFFGCLDEHEGDDIFYNKLDIGIGRIPASTPEHAKSVVDKIDRYLNNSDAGTWKTDITFVADDNSSGENNIHISDAEEISVQVYNNYPSFNHHKIYLDDYVKENTSTGGKYPDVNKAIKEKLEGGTLIFNYTGHGNEKTLAHEQILTTDDILQLTNKSKLPVFVTATCEFSRFDEYKLISAGEWVLLSPNGGGIALFTTTRIAWSNYNSEINKNFYKHVFDHDENNQQLCLGDIIMKTKNSTSNSVNKINFHLLGDPAIKLQYPANEILTHSINDEIEVEQRESLTARSIATVEGKIIGSENSSNQHLTIKVFDKPTKKTTRGNGGFTPFEYEVYQNRIFEGEMDVSENHFLSTFMVPNDIQLNIGEGRISYYSYDDEGNEAFGADNSVLIGGMSEDANDDTVGPEITTWLNDPSFKDGDITGSQPILYANFSDISGINISGVGIGHDITMIIDDMRSSPINLNHYYTADKNTYKSGKLQVQLPKLDPGKHTVELKAWDNLNNSSVAILSFEVNLDGALKITNTELYPNPVANSEIIKIAFEHDAPNTLFDITCRIYSMDGSLIYQAEQTHPATGNRVEPLEITIRNMDKGLYIFHCEIRSSENQIGKFSKKILVIR